MTATQFTDDAFNKFCKEGHGTLIGNWFEELSIRDSTGIGRSVPKFGTKKASQLQGEALVDDTFERIYGHRTYDVVSRTSDLVGAGDKEDVVKKPVAETLQALGRINTKGKRELQEFDTMLEFAKEEVQKEDDLEGEKRNERFFQTSTGESHTKPDMTQTSLPEFLKDSKKQELLRGPAPDRMRALRNKGLELDGVSHYSNSAAVSHHTMSLADPRSQADIRLSAPTGANIFGKNSEFSRPVNEFMKGTLKDDVVLKMHQQSDTLRAQEYAAFRKSNAGAEPPAATPVSSLAVLKQTIRVRLAEKWGGFAFVMLRKQLSEKADHELLILKQEALRVLKEDLGLQEEEAPEVALKVWMDQLVTMRKDALRVGDLLRSLRPHLENANKGLVLEAYMALPKGAEGFPSLQDWVAALSMQEVKDTLFMAFDVPEEAANTVPIPEKVFLEFYSDLAPFLESIDPVLPKAA